MPSQSHLGAFLLSFGAYAVAMNTVPGPWRRWKENGGGATDPWTWTHLGWGAAGRAFGLSLEELALLAVVNEVGEEIVRQERPDLLWGEPETLANQAVDVGATAAGWLALDRLL